MAPEEVHAWLTGIFGPLSVHDVAGFHVASASVTPVAVSVGFSAVDTGVVVDGAAGTEIRCELVCAAAGTGATLERRVMAVAGAWKVIVDKRLPAHPGVLVPDLVHDPALTVHHGWLREPRVFDEGTPYFTEPGRMTLLLELVLLTDEEYGIAVEHGIDFLERRLRRRQMDLGDWCRG